MGLPTRPGGRSTRPGSYGYLAATETETGTPSKQSVTIRTLGIFNTKLNTPGEL